MTLERLQEELTHYDHRLLLEFKNGEYVITHEDAHRVRYPWQKIPIGQLDRGVEILENLWLNDFRKHDRNEFKKRMDMDRDTEENWHKQKAIDAAKIKERVSEIAGMACSAVGSRVYGKGIPE